jgi:hypothetical protein
MTYVITPADRTTNATQISIIFPTTSPVSSHVRHSAEIPGSCLRCELRLSLESSFTRISPNSDSSEGRLCGLPSVRIVQYG